MIIEHPLSTEIEAIAAGLIQARASGKRVQTTALPAPANAMSAMQIQALVQEQLARPVRGWKVAVGPEIGPIAAPLSDIHAVSAELALFENCAIEVELAVRLGRDLPRRETGTYDRSDILKAVDSVNLGVEVIGGRFDNAEKVDFLSFLADNLGNKAYIIGDELPLCIVDQASGLWCHVALNGKALYHAPASHPAGDPLLPLLAYANQQSDYLGGLKAGQIVTTGSVCGVLPVRAAGLLKAELDHVGQVSVRFTD